MNLTRSNIALGIGTVVAGKFRIERMLAEGGMGLVVAATHLQLEQTVALKFFRGDLGTEGEPLMRFMREAKAAAQLRSEHVARVLDVGITDGGTPYMVLEYLEGQGLDHVVATEGPMDAPTATEYAIQACEGLAEAHARGIIHRDIKPSNLFLVERSPGWRTIKILDFGISKVSLTHSSNITTNLTMGTPCYMSPEQLQSTASVDHRTDIWSLGSTLYELLTGHSPFNPRLPLPAIAQEIVNRKPPSVFDLRPEVPRELSAIVARCMAKNREERFDSAAALAMALLPFARARARVSAERAASMTPAFGGKGDGQAPSSPWEGTPSTRHGGQVSSGNGGPNTPPDGRLAEDHAAESRPVPVFRQPGVMAAGVVLVLIVAAVAYRNARRQGPLPPSQGSSSDMSLAPSPAPPALSAACELVVRVSPPTARIMIDGAVVPDNPFRGRFRRGGIHQIEAFAPGFETKAEQASLTTDLVVNLSLDKRLPPPENPDTRPPSRAPRTRRLETQAERTNEPPIVRPPPATLPELVDPAGGRAPLHPIETKSPYENQ